MTGFRGNIGYFIAGDPGSGHTIIDKSGLHVYRNSGAHGLMADINSQSEIIVAYNSAGNVVLLANTTSGNGYVQIGDPTNAIWIRDYNSQPIDNPKVYRQIVYVNLGDFTSAAMVDYVTGLASITVPIWARSVNAVAEIMLTMHGVLNITAGANTWAFRAVADSTNGTTTQEIAATASDQVKIGAGISYTIPGVGPIAIKLQAQRVAGTGALRANTAGGAFIVVDAVIHI